MPSNPKRAGGVARPVILLADDHKIVAQGLQRLLEPEFRVAAIFEDGRSLVESAGRFKPDVIVTDISMPLLNGIEAIQQLKKLVPHVRVIVLTMHSNIAYFTEAFRAGAMGYVLKGSAVSELSEAIHSVLRGKTYLSAALREGMEVSLPSDGEIAKGSRQSLSLRERQVLQLLAEGRIAKEIGAFLGISSKTAEFHKYRMMRKLGLRTVAELAAYAVRHGIVAADS